MYIFLKSDKVEKLFFSIACATIFTFALCHWMIEFGYKYEYENQTGPIVDMNWFIGISIIIILYYSLRIRQLYFDFAFLIITQTMILASVIDYQRQEYAGVCYAWMMSVSYLLGKVIINSNTNSYKNDELVKRVFVVFGTLSTGMFLCSFLDYSFIFGRYDTWEYGEAWPSFFRPLSYIGRTTYDFGFVLAIAATLISLSQLKKHKLISLAGIIMAVIPQIFSVKYHARLAPCLLVLCIVVSVVIYLISHWDEKNIRIRFRNISIITGIVLCICLILFRLNVLGLYERYMNSYWGDDGGIIKNIRFTLDWKAFRDIINNPLDSFEDNHGHSMMLEYGRLYDLSIYILLIIYRILVTIDAVRLTFNKEIPEKIKYLLIPAFAAINMYYSMEPNASHHRYFLMAGLFIFGMIKGCLEAFRSQTN